MDANDYRNIKQGSDAWQSAKCGKVTTDVEVEIDHA